MAKKKEKEFKILRIEFKIKIKKELKFWNLNKRWKLDLKTKIKCEEGPSRNKKWGILKYLSAEISFEKSKIILGRMTCVSGALGQKLGYDNLNLHIS